MQHEILSSPSPAKKASLPKINKTEPKLKIKNLRPSCFEEFPGQDQVKDKLKLFVSACLKRGEPLDHCLFIGPPGLGKTTLAHIIAHTLKVELKISSGPAIRRKGDIAALLTTLKENTLFFIDEIHRLPKDVEEYLYSAMEDFYIDIITGEGFGARSMRFQLPPFTLVGATTRIGLLKSPFRDRFGIVERLSFYDKKALSAVLLRSAKLLQTPITQDGADEIAKRSRGTPRTANRLLKRVRDVVQAKGHNIINAAHAARALQYLGVDDKGLDFMDLKILLLMKEHFQGEPVGVDTLSAVLGEEPDTLEDFYEPFLIQQGLLRKTPRGRVLTDLARTHLKGKL